MESATHPSYYKGDNDMYEPFKVADAWGLDNYTFSATKYICRAGKKYPDKQIEDLEKAITCLEKKIAKLRSEASNAYLTTKKDPDSFGC